MWKSLLNLFMQDVFPPYMPTPSNTCQHVGSLSMNPTAFEYLALPLPVPGRGRASFYFAIRYSKAVGSIDKVLEGVGM